MKLKLIAGLPLAAVATFAIAASPAMARPHRNHHPRTKVCHMEWHNHHRVKVCHWR